MKVPYLQIIAFTFFRFLVTVRAVPTGDGLTALSSGLRMDKSLQDKSAQIGAALNPSKLQKPALPLPMQGRGLPVNVMQNTDESRPLVPTDHYETDVSRLTGGGPQ